MRYGVMWELRPAITSLRPHRRFARTHSLIRNWRWAGADRSDGHAVIRACAATRHGGRSRRSCAASDGGIGGAGSAAPAPRRRRRSCRAGGKTRSDGKTGAHGKTCAHGAASDGETSDDATSHGKAAHGQAPDVTADAAAHGRAASCCAASCHAASCHAAAAASRPSGGPPGDAGNPEPRPAHRTAPPERTASECDAGSAAAADATTASRTAS